MGGAGRGGWGGGCTATARGKMSAVGAPVAAARAHAWAQWWPPVGGGMELLAGAPRVRCRGGARGRVVCAPPGTPAGELPPRARRWWSSRAGGAGRGGAGGAGRSAADEVGWASGGTERHAPALCLSRWRPLAIGVGTLCGMGGGCGGAVAEGVWKVVEIMTLCTLFATEACQRPMQGLRPIRVERSIWCVSCWWRGKKSSSRCDHVAGTAVRPFACPSWDSNPAKILRTVNTGLCLLPTLALMYPTSPPAETHPPLVCGFHSMAATGQR